MKFIESEGLDSEGIYRVPGNRAHVDLLFQKFEEGRYHVADLLCILSCNLLLITDGNVQISELDIPVNAVATALKDFVSKRLPPLFEEDVMAELEEIAGMPSDHQCTYLFYLLCFCFFKELELNLWLQQLETWR